MRSKLFKRKEEKTKMLTLDEIKKAFADLSEEDKKEFYRSVKLGDGGDLDEQERTGDEAAVQKDEAPEGETDGAEEVAEEQTEDAAPESGSDEDEEAREDAEAKTEGGDEPSIDEIMELLVKFDARLSAIEHANEAEKPAVTEVGVDGEYADEIAPSMPKSYLEQAKKMRY